METCDECGVLLDECDCECETCGDLLDECACEESW